MIEDDFTNHHIKMIQAIEGESLVVFLKFQECVNEIIDSIMKDFDLNSPMSEAIAKKIQKLVDQKLKGFYENEWPKILEETRREVASQELAFVDKAIESNRKDKPTKFIEDGNGYFLEA